MSHDLALSNILPFNTKKKCAQRYNCSFLNSSEMGFILFLVEHLYLMPCGDGFILSNKHVND